MPAWRTFTVAAIHVAVTFARAAGAVDPRDGSGGSADLPAAPVRPAWNFSWATLPVWASGQGVTDFSEEDARHLARFGVVWTQGMRWNPPPKFSGDYVPFSPPRAGYETWESAIISDAKKLRAIKPSLPVLGYCGYGGCCTGRNEWWLENYTSAANSALWLRDDTGTSCSPATLHRSSSRCGISATRPWSASSITSFCGTLSSPTTWQARSSTASPATPVWADSEP